MVGLTRLVLDSAKLVGCSSLVESLDSHDALDALDVVDMQVYLLLEHDQVVVSLDFQVVLARVDFGLQLFHLLLLLVQQIVSLVLSILLPQLLNSLRLLDLENLELLSVVLCFFDSLIDGDQLFVLLHFFERGLGLDLDVLDSAVQFLVEHFHLLLVVVLEVFDAHQALVLILLELSLPLPVELLQLVITNFYVLSQLMLLDMRPQLVLVVVDIFFE